MSDEVKEHNLNISSVEQEEVYSLLCNRWSLRRVRRWMLETRDLDLSVSQLKAFRETIPNEHFVRKSTLRELFDNLDIEVDAVGEMGRLLEIQSDRLGTALLVEKATKNRVPYVDTAVKSYWRMLKDYVAIRQSMGTMPLVEDNQKLQLVSSDTQQQLPTLQALFIDARTSPQDRHNEADIIDMPSRYVEVGEE